MVLVMSDDLATGFIQALAFIYIIGLNMIQPPPQVVGC